MSRMNMNYKYPHLFSQLIIGSTVFNNRIFASATGPTNLTSRKAPSAETCALYERKAVGGAAAVCMGNCTVDTTIGRSVSSNIDLGDRSIIPQLAKLATAISRHGSVPSIELQHGGNHSFGSWQEGHQIYGPMEYIDEQGRHILAMTEEVIEKTIESFAQAAVLAKQSGFGMVTIHGGHGWLISQFVSPISNTRTDRWGGSVENRCRLPVAICDAVKKAAGRDFPVEIRISGSECHPGGYGIDEGIAIARQLDGHADIIHVSAGSHEVQEVFTVTHPSMFLEDGANVKYAAEIKKHIKKSYVATVGALADPDLMEEIIASGKADIIAVARGLLADHPRTQHEPVRDDFGLARVLLENGKKVTRQSHERSVRKTGECGTGTGPVQAAACMRFIAISWRVGNPRARTCRSAVHSISRHSRTIVQRSTSNVMKAQHFR